MKKQKIGLFLGMVPSCPESATDLHAFTGNPHMACFVTFLTKNQLKNTPFTNTFNQQSKLMVSPIYFSLAIAALTCLIPGITSVQNYEPQKQLCKRICMENVRKFWNDKYTHEEQQFAEHPSTEKGLVLLLLKYQHDHAASHWTRQGCDSACSRPKPRYYQGMQYCHPAVEPNDLDGYLGRSNCLQSFRIGLDVTL